MKLIILNNKEDVVKKSALMLFEEIKKNPSIVLGLATGNTMKPIYKKFVALAQKNKLDVSKIITFNADEYIIDDKNKSMRYFMDRFLFKPLKIRKNNIHFPEHKVNGRNAKRICNTYEDKIMEFGGIDFQLLGVGRNGHIAFNEPGSNIKSKCRIVNLHKATRENMSRNFKGLKKTPEKALTLGIKNILEAKKIILVAFGFRKAEAIKKAGEELITKKVPASFLRKHKNVTFIIDKEAGSLLKK